MFSDAYKDRTVLVTGNTGFKGSWLTVWLLQLGAKVVGLSNDIPTDPSMFVALGLQQNIDHRFANVVDTAAVAGIIDETRPDVVFHLAAQPIVAKSYSDPLETLRTNVLGTASILDALRHSEKECYAVMITSDKCYENVEWTWGYRENDRLGGKDPYSASKAGAEIVIYTYFHSYFSSPESKIRLTSTRAGNVIGGGDWAPNRIIPDTVRAWSEDQPVVIRSPKATRPWQHVLEPLSGYLHLGQRLMSNIDLCGQSFNFGPAADQVFTVDQCLNAMAEHWRFKTSHEPFVVQRESGQFHEAGLLKLNCDKAFHELGWKPALTFEESVSMTADWYANFYEHGPGAMYELTRKQLLGFCDAARSANLSWCN